MATKRILALLLALCLTVSIPVNALAEEQAGDSAEWTEDIASAEPDGESAPAEDLSGMQDASPEDPSGTQDASPEDSSGTQDASPDDTQEEPPEDVLPEEEQPEADQPGPAEEDLLAELYAELEGDGTEENPYLVRTEEHLIALALNQIDNAGISWYQLMNDIVLNPDTWSPIGRTDAEAFNGVFDGDGHTISSSMQFQATSDTLSGIFGVNKGTIKNLTVNVTIADTATDAGTLCAQNFGTIENCFGYGSVSSTVSGKSIGGLVGYNGGRITGCGSGAEVNAPNSSGGGLVGTHRDGGMIEYCSASGNVTANCAGGLIGEQYVFETAVARTRYSYATGKVTGSSYGGGLIGFHHTGTGGYRTPRSYVEFCYAAGTVASGANRGGLFGAYAQNQGYAIHKYNYYNRSNDWNLYGYPVSLSDMMKAETFYGWDFDNIWAVSSSVNSGYPYIVGRAPGNVSVSGSGTQTDPYQITNERQLFAIGALELDGAMSAYYLLMNDIKVTANYWTPIGLWGDFTGVFDGNGHTISGLRHLCRDSYNETGLFAYNSGTIRNLNVSDIRLMGRQYTGAAAAVNRGTIENCHVTAASQGNIVVSVVDNAYVGGLVGHNTGTIRRSSANCNSGGADQRASSELKAVAEEAATTVSGGLLGVNADGGVVEYSWSEGYVKGSHAGGLIGEQYAFETITVKTLNSYSVSTVTGSSSSGGLIGYNHTGTGGYRSPHTYVEFCYARGRVEGGDQSGGLIGRMVTGTDSGYNHVRFSYYNQSYGTNKIGFKVSLTDMKDAKTFYGWDFSHIWQIDKSVNSGLPYVSLNGNPSPIRLEGNGDEAHPYLIHSEEELWALVLDQGDYSLSVKQYYKLANDITVTAMHWTPIGSNGQNSFAGVFDGDGHAISGIRLSDNYYSRIGLFGEVTGTVQNLSVSAELEGVDWAGVLTASNRGTIKNCHTSGVVTNVTNGGLTGGLAGWNVGTIMESSSSAEVGKATETAGGLVGQNNDGGLIQYCWASGNVKGGHAGGLAGEQYVFETAEAKILNSFASGAVTGSTSSGGLIGYDHTGTGGYRSPKTYVEYCYASGTVSGGDQSGGLIGRLVTGTSSGANYLRYSYYNGQNAGNKYGFRVSLSEMSAKDTFYMWDFTNIWNIDPAQNGGRPFIHMRGTPGTPWLDGYGEEEDPYLIETEEDLWVLVTNTYNLEDNVYYQLQNDIEVTANYWTPIGGNGAPAFRGVFDGNGFTISGLRMADNYYDRIGFVGVNMGTIKNLNVSADLDASGCVGAVCAENRGTVEGCSSVGTVRCSGTEAAILGGLIGYNTGAVRTSCSSARVSGSASCVGGLVGEAYEGGLIERCYAMGDVSGSTAGGLIGAQHAFETAEARTVNSYAGGSVTGTSYAGGLIGRDYTGSGGYRSPRTFVEYCYSMGRVLGSGQTGGLVGQVHTGVGSNTIISSYYDSTLSEKSDIDRGTPLDSSQMKQQAQYVGWDFDNTWRINPAKNGGYPYLAEVEPETVIHATGVRLDQTELVLKVGSSGRLTATVEPSGASNKAVTWTSSDSSVATVANGAVTALKAGITVITVSTIDGGYTAACTVTVTNDAPVVVAVTGVTLNKTSTTIEIGKTETLTATVAPANATNKNVTWTSSNPSVATVSGSGVVTAVAAGTAAITVITVDGNKIAACTVTVPQPQPVVVAVTGVSLNKTSTTIEIGKSETLTATVAPANATNKNVTWTSSNPSVATVSGSGVVTAVAAGTATITVTTADGSKTAVCTVTVPQPQPVVVAVTGVTLNKTSATIEIGKTETLTATVAPSNATDKSVTWTSSNPSVATVSGSGVVTAIAAGMATITVTTADGSKTAACTVTVPQPVVPVTGVSLNKTSLCLGSGGAVILTATVIPANASNKNVIWESSNSRAVRVDSNGKITAVEQGTALITVTTEDGKKVASCSVEVRLRVSIVTNVAISPASLTLIEGETATLTATLTPIYAANWNMSWSSSDPSVATVSKGVVTAQKPGEAVITVLTEDGAKTDTAKVTVKPKPAVLSGLELTGEVTTIEGMPLDLSGLVVTAVYSSGERVAVTDYTVEGFNASQIGAQTVTIGYEGKTASLTVTVRAKSVTGIAIDSPPSKTSYTEGEALNQSGLRVKAFYDNGTDAVITSGFTLSGYDANTVGAQSVLVTYAGFTTSFAVTVTGKSTGGSIAKPVIRIESVEGGKNVILSASEGSTIRYTTDGSQPAVNSQTYTGAFKVTRASTVIKAIAVSGSSTSSVTTGTIKVSQVGAVDANPGSSNVQAGTIVTLRTATVGAEIYYTDSPDAAFSKDSWTKYNGAIVIGRTQNIRAIAVKDGYVNSAPTRLDYTVPEPPKDNVVISLGSVTVAAGDIASVPVYLFTDSEETPIKDFRLSMSFDAKSFENVVSITPADGLDSTKLFTSTSSGVVNLLYQGDEIRGGGEICTLNFTTLASMPEGTTLDVEVNLGGSSIKTDAAGGSSLTSANAVITLTAARINQATGTFTYTNAATGEEITNIQNIPENAKEIEANVTIDSDSAGTMRETTANVYLVVYDRDGRMASVDTWKVDLSDPAFMFIRTIKIPEGTDVGAIKIMVLSDQMVPVMAAGELAK